MSIYDLDIKGMRQLMRKFHKTTYGQTVFLLAYVIPFMTFVSSAIMALVSCITQDSELLYISGIVAVVFVVTFILGNIYFYSELRKFSLENSSKKK